MTYEKKEDAFLLRAYNKGDEQAFEELVRRHKSKVYTTIYLIVKDHYVAEDLLQETFIKAVNTVKSGNYNEEGKFLPWLLRIAHNKSIDYFRKQKRYPTVATEDGTSVFNSMDFSEMPYESRQMQQETQAMVRDMIKQLPDTQREVLVMRHYSGMSFKDIAEATGVSINTALGRMRYALINLRKQMDTQNIAYEKLLYPE